MKSYVKSVGIGREVQALNLYIKQSHYKSGQAQRVLGS
jgi:hypothetical protein